MKSLEAANRILELVDLHTKPGSIVAYVHVDGEGDVRTGEAYNTFARLSAPQVAAALIEAVEIIKAVHDKTIFTCDLEDRVVKFIVEHSE